MPRYTSRGRYWLTQDRSRVVPEGDPAAAFLYTVPGRDVDEAEADKLGLLALDRAAAKGKAKGKADPDPAPDPAPEPEPERAPAPDTKAVAKGEVEDKAVPGPKSPRGGA